MLLIQHEDFGVKLPAAIEFVQKKFERRSSRRKKQNGRFFGSGSSLPRIGKSLFHGMKRTAADAVFQPGCFQCFEGSASVEQRDVSDIVGNFTERSANQIFIRSAGNQVNGAGKAAAKGIDNYLSSKNI